MNFEYVVRGFFREIENRIRYGRKCPKVSERIWVKARSCTKSLDSFDLCGCHKSVAKGLVLKEWDESRAFDLFADPKFTACIARWEKGLPWENTGIFESELRRIRECGSADGCKNIFEIKKRYERIENMYRQIKDEGRVRARYEINRFEFRERGGIIIHINPEGEIYFGKGGNHRFAAAWVLNLTVPAELGCIFRGAIPELEKYRKQPNLFD